MRATFYTFTLDFDPGVTIYRPRGPRPRSTADLPLTDATTGNPITLPALDVALWIAPAMQTIHAQIANIPAQLLLYGPDDFLAVVTDPIEAHRDRLLQILGSDPAAILQTLLDRRPLPTPPPRVPHEIANWRARAILEIQGLLPAVESALATLEGPPGIIARAAWQSGSPLARHGQTVLSLASHLALTDPQLDSMFIAAAALEV